MNIRRFIQALKRAEGYDGIDIVEQLQMGNIEKTDFEEWWYGCGSGLAPMPGEDSETHAKRVCETFYKHITEFA